MRTLLQGLVLVLCASACGTPKESKEPSSAQAADGTGSNGLICREEAQTGTTITRTVCRTPQQIEDDRKRADDMLRVPPASPSNAR